MSKEFIGFKFKHPTTGEEKVVTMSLSEIQDLLEDHLIERLVEMEDYYCYDYTDYLYEFELVGGWG